MAKDWEKLAGEQGEDIPTGRFQRLFQIGKMGARVTASTIVSKAASMLPMGDAKSREVRRQDAYAQNAQHMVDVLGKLKGASMKIGQLLSADPELVPQGFGEVLSSLQNNAPPMTYMTVKAQIEEAFDLPIEVIFKSFDPEPIGSASIGQVHRAILDTGEHVAVKIQYPHVVDALESDMKTLRTLMMYGSALIDKERRNAYLEEIKAMILIEADYEAEAQTLNRFFDILSTREGVRSPKAFIEWTRKNVLVMEYMSGKKLDEALKAHPKGSDTRTDIAKRWVQTYTWMFHELHEMHGDPHPGNFLVQEDGTLVLLDFGSVKAFDTKFTDGILDLLDAHWQDEHERAIHIYKHMGFGQKNAALDRISADLLAKYHEIIFAPFLKNEPFNFSGWNPSFEADKFMWKHPSMLKLMPPSEFIAYFRMLSGVKGLLSKMEIELNVCAMAIDAARRRERLTGEPMV